MAEMINKRSLALSTSLNIAPQNADKTMYATSVTTDANVIFINVRFMYVPQVYFSLIILQGTLVVNIRVGNNNCPFCISEIKYEVLLHLKQHLKIKESAR